MEIFWVAVVFTLVSMSATAEIVNINTASADEIAEALLGVGTKQAAAIVEYRQQNGPFQMLDDLTQVAWYWSLKR